MIEVLADQLFVGDTEHAFECAVGRGDHGVIDLLHGGGAGGFEGEVHEADIGRWHADGDTVALAIEFGHHETHRFGRAGGCWDHGHGGGAGAIEIFVHGIKRGLVASIAVHGGHKAFDDADLVIEYFGDRREAVGRAGGV